MVAKPRLLLAVASALTLVLTAAAPMSAATKEAKPSPLRAANLLRVKDIAANGNTKGGAIVAIGWHEASKPGRLYLTFSRNGGKDFYRNSNGNLRRYPIVGEPKLGMSIDVCAGRVWAATGYSSPSDKAGDSDVFLTSRTIGGGAAQALLTSTSADRRVRDVTVSCVSNELIAIGWLQKTANKTTAQLMLRSLEQLGTTPSFKKTYNLGSAELKSGLDVAATASSVAVTFVRDGHLRLKRFDIEAPTNVTSNPLRTIAWKDIKQPVMDARGKRLAVAYSDAGKVRVKTSRDLGVTLSKPSTLAGTGGIKNPSRAYSLDLVGDRVVATLGVYSKAAGKVTPQRLTSSTFGEKWSKRSFGNRGARYAALLKKKGQGPLVVETWHNNAAKGARDTLRARYELP
ncbi:MAG: hypothetical protein AB1Z66_07575 [Candidatus Limnocylindrales bacterium]